MPKSTVFRDLSQAADILDAATSASQSAEHAARAAFLASMEPLAAKAKAGASKLQAIIEKYDGQIRRLHRPDDSQWNNSSAGRSATVYGRLDGLLKEWATRRALIGNLNGIDDQIRKLYLHTPYARAFHQKELVKHVENMLGAVEQTEGLAVAIAAVAGEIAARETGHGEVSNG